MFHCKNYVLIQDCMRHIWRYAYVLCFAFEAFLVYMFVHCCSVCRLCADGFSVSRSLAWDVVCCRGCCSEEG